jgi:hypothetical protein
MREPSEKAASRQLQAVVGQHLTNLSYFLPYDTPNDIFQWFFVTLNMLTESSVNHGLVITATPGIHFPTEPFKNIIIDANGDPGFARWNRIDGPSLAV